MYPSQAIAAARHIWLEKRQINIRVELSLSSASDPIDWSIRGKMILENKLAGNGGSGTIVFTNAVGQTTGRLVGKQSEKVPKESPFDVGTVPLES